MASTMRVERFYADTKKVVLEDVPIPQPERAKFWSRLLSASSSNLEKRPDPVEYQLGSLRDDPVSYAVDQLDLEIAYVVAISVGQIRGDHRIFGTCQPANGDGHASPIEP